MRKAVVLLLVALALKLSAQDISSFITQMKGVTRLPQNMTFGEFEKLQRNVTWQRLFAAAVLPGYIHFYAGHKRAGYTIATVRSAGAMLTAYALADEIRQSSSLGVPLFGVSDTLNAYKARSERNLALFFIGLALNTAGYAFDWGHGDFIIERERNAVLYKYGLQKNWQPAVGVWLDSRRNLLGPTIRISFGG